MRKSTLLLLVFVLLLACSPSAQTTPTSATAAVPEIPTLMPDATSPGANPQSPAATIPPTLPAQLSGTSTDTLNIRSGPGLQYAVLGQLKEGDPITIIGKSADGLWWQFDRGWVSATYVKVVGDPTVVPVATPNATPAS